MVDLTAKSTPISSEYIETHTFSAFWLILAVYIAVIHSDPIKNPQLTDDMAVIHISDQSGT